MNQLLKKLRSPISIILIAGLFLFIIGNNNFTLYDNSETTYAAVAKEIVNTGDGLTMHLNNVNWYIHPPLYFWIASTYCEIFGWNEFNLRLPEALGGILGMIAIFLIAKLAYSRKTALYSALIMGTSMSYFVISRLAIFDTILNAFILLAVYFFLRAYKEPSKKGKFFFLFALSCFFGVLTKGPIGLVHPCAAIVIFLLIKRDIKFLFDWKVILNFGFFLLITSPWYAHQLIVNGEPFFNKALKDYTWYRFFGVIENQPGPWWYYFPMLIAFVPWTFFLPTIIKDFFVKEENKEKNDIKLFIWVFMIFTFLFFSLAGTKLPSYIFSLFPFAAILIADQFTSFKNKKTIQLSTISTVIFFSLLFIYGFLLKLPAPYTAERPLIATFFLIPLIGIIVFSYLLLKEKVDKAIASITVATIIFCMFLAFIFFPRLDLYKDSKLFIDTIQKQQITEYSIGAYRHNSPYMYYYQGQRIQNTGSLQDIEGVLKQEKPYFLMTRNEHVTSIMDYFKERAEVLSKHPLFSTVVIYK